MKKVAEMTQAETAAYVQEHLRSQGITVILSGGAAVAVYSMGKYVSADIDLVNAYFSQRGTIEQAMAGIGFKPVGRHFEHPDSEHIIEFPPGPLEFGMGKAGGISEIEYETGTLHLISPTDCVKDRLAHFFHWGDRQCLDQAVLVAKDQPVNLEEIRDWSRSEGKLDDFNRISELLRGTAQP